MYYSLLFLGAILFLIVFGLLIVEIYIKTTRYGQHLVKFHGPKAYPVIGCVFDLLDSPVGIFNKLRQWAKEFHPVYIIWSATAFPSIHFFVPEDLQTILSNTKHNDKSPIYDLFHQWLGEGLLTSNGEKWQQRRKIITPTFHFNILRRFVAIFNRHSVGLVKGFEEDIHSDVEILSHIHKASLHTIAESAMGVTLKDKESEKKYRHSIHRVGEITVYRILRPWLYFRVLGLFTKHFYEELFLLKYLKGFTQKVINEREATFNEAEIDALHEEYQQTQEDDDIYTSSKKKKRLAMLDLLLSAKKRNEIDNEGICEEVDTFMFEGHDTVSMSLMFTFMLLANYPDVQEKLYTEIISVLGHNKSPGYDDLQKLTYMELVIKESLRLYPSVPLISRLAGEDFSASNGQVVPKGACLIMHIFDTHRLASLYPDPEKFIPERFTVENSKDRHPYAYLPFSAGSRNCIGQRYAMLNMKCKIAAIVRNFRLFPVDTPESITLIADIILRTKEPIRIRVKSRE